MGGQFQPMTRKNLKRCSVASAWLLAVLGIVSAGPAAARIWVCSAEAKFDVGIVLASVRLDEYGAIRRPASFDYFPKGNTGKLQINLEYGSDQHGKILLDRPVVSTVYNSSSPLGDAMLQFKFGNYEKSKLLRREAILPHGSGIEINGRLDSDPKLSEALRAGGTGKLSVIGTKGDVLVDQDISFAPAVVVKSVSEQAYQGALRLGSNPKASSFCADSLP